MMYGYVNGYFVWLCLLCMLWIFFMAMDILYNSSYYVCLCQFNKAMAILYCYKYYVLIYGYGYSV